MPCRPTPTRSSPALLIAAALALAGCASTPAGPPLSTAMPLPAALGLLGTAETIDGQDGIEIVLIRDRHSLGRGLSYVDEHLRAIQREHDQLMTHLVDRGFRVLGCECTLGPLPDDAAAAQHVEAMKDALAAGDDLNRWSIYQPLRYREQWLGRLTVRGVEDPELYAADIATLEAIHDLWDMRRSVDEASKPPERALDAEEARLLARIRSNVHARGRAAARNMVALMRDLGETNGILMLGAAHAAGASSELAQAGIRHHVFTTRSFERKHAR